MTMAWERNRNSVILGVCVFATSFLVSPRIVAQDKESQQETREEPLTPFLVKSSWLTFGVFDGRIQARDIRRTQSRSLTLYHENNSAEEHLIVRTLPGKYRIKYALQSPGELLQLEYDIAGEFFIRRELEGVKVQLRQSSTGPIRIQVERAGELHQYRAERLWLALLLIPQSDRSYVVSMLHRLCPHTHVALLFDESLKGLKRLALAQADLGLSEIRTLVALLDDDSFAVRQQADRQLRALGRPIVGLLEHVDYSELSAEQRTRLGLIVKSYKVLQPDTVESIVATMKWNPRFWLVLTAGEQDQQVAINAKRHFRQLIGSNDAGNSYDALTNSNSVLLRLR